MSGATYNLTRFTRQVLKRHRRAPPSVVIHLYPTHFRFEHQHGNFGYDSPMKCFLEAVREQKLPTDLLDVLDEAGVRYYDGCLIVEVHDHRQSPAANPPNLRSSLSASFSLSLAQNRETPATSKAEVYRIVLAPNPATLWTELSIASRKMEQEALAAGRNEVGWTEDEAVEIESVILNRTMPPLCLSPSVQTSRIANSMLRATTLRPPKRNRFCSTGDCSDGDDGEEGQKREREEHEKLMKVGDEGVPRTRGPAFSRLAFIQAYRERQQNPTLAAQPGSSATSIRLGGAQQQQQQQHQQHQQQQAAAAAQAAIPAIPTAQAHAAALVRETPRGSRAGSPAVSVTSGRPHKKPKTLDTMSDSGSGVSATINTAAQQKKAAKLAAAANAAAAAQAAASVPVDPNETPQAAAERTEREKVQLEKKRMQQQQKRAQAQRRKERKKAELEKAAQASDLQVGTPGSSVAGTPNWQG
ncbi:hypothetical protein JCM10908_004612 [Rhodotorula pacifica]|uniref:Spt20p n=1 Tax=Rhodotorula pacifica TaxID=1495444 RepID=UPI003177BC8E